MKRILWFFIFLCLLCQIGNTQTSISGVINNYAKVTAIDSVCQSKLTVDDTTGFEVGMIVILIQIKGAAIDESNSASFGDVLDLGSAGFYEKNEVDSINATCIFLKYKFLHNYNVNGKVQLVTMPSYQNAIITDTLTAQAWDGDTGGVLTFSVDDTLTLNENIDVSGKGFRGGNSISVPGNNCTWLVQQNDFFYDLNNWRGALKGEGAAEFIAGKEAGKGAQFNGGGGGNDHNSGGGGGSNVSLGGKGGNNDEPSLFGCQGDHPGIGGKNYNVDTTRLFFGGGGGAGHGNNNVGTNGGNGGGMVILEAENITSNGLRIMANGETPPDGGGDGGGGGSSGGTLVMKVGSFSDAAFFELKGGNGGLIDNGGAQRCHGPGGGGGGGRLLVSTTGGWTLTNNGGTAGMSINSAGCPVSNNGAEDGTDGSTEDFVDIPESTIEYGAISIENQPVSQQICEGNPISFTISVNGGPSNFQWQVDDGNGFQDISDGLEYMGTMTDTLIISNPSVMMSGWIFQCIVSSNCGNLISDPATLEVTETASISSQPMSVSICEGSNAGFLLVASGSNEQYQWQVDDGSGFQNISDGVLYSGTQTDTLTVLNPTSLMSGWVFQSVLTTDCGELISETATLVVTLTATILEQPVSVTVCLATDTTFSVDVSGSNIQYQWQFDNGTGFQNATDGGFFFGVLTDSLTILNPNSIISGWIFQCLITTDCGDLISDAVTLEVISIDLISIDPDFLYVCEDSSATIKTHVLGSNAQFQYQWQVDEGAGFYNLSDNATYSNTNSEILGISMISFAMDGYIYRCIIIYECGLVTSDESLLTVESEPIAQFDFMTNGGSVDFNNLSSFNSVSYIWDFGDNSTSSEVDPVHDYSQSGIYIVQLIAFNDCGSDTTFQEVEVSFLAPPEVDFTLNNGTGCAPLLVQFSDQSVGEIDNWQWNFPGGNPNSSTEQNPQVLYENPGTFDVTLEVTNSAGSNLVTFEDLIFVDLPIFAGFSFLVNENVVTFINTSQNATAFQWDFGDNSAESSEENPVHEFAVPGVYMVTLVATNPLCGSAITQAVDVLFTGNKEIVGNDYVKVYPNPVNDLLTIEFLRNNSSKDIKFFHSNGQIVLKEDSYEGEKFEVDFSNIPSGIYILEVMIDEKVFIDKIVKY